MTPAKIKPPVRAIAVDEPTAAAALSVGATFFRENIAPDIPCIRVKGKRLWSVASLERWASEREQHALERSAA